MRCVTLAAFFLLCSVAFSQSIDFRTIDFSKADSVALINKGKSLKNLPLLTHDLTVDLTTDVEKFRVIFSWVCTNIKNDYHSYLRTSKKRKKIEKDREAFMEWNKSFTPKVFEQLVNERRTACTGYAYLIKEMANLAGIPSKIINGYGRTPTLLLTTKSPSNHSWNAIKLNDQWYLCDATWSAGKIMLDDNGPRFEPDYDDVYFLTDPRIFIKNHYPLEQEMSFLEKTPSLTDFIDGPVVYKEAFEHKIFPTEPKKMHVEILRDKKMVFELNIPNDSETDNFVLTMNSGGRDFSAKPKVTRLEGNNVRLEHTYDHTGLYDTHIKLGDDIIATYVIKVKKN